MELISIIIPIYKKEDTLKRCVDSILCQTYENIEIILINDGSPDKCANICDKYARIDERIVVIHQKNTGVSAARNTGLDHMCGEYVAFVDADDMLDRDSLEILYNDIKHNNADIAVCSSKLNKEKKQVLSRQDAICQMFSNDNFGVNVWGKLYKSNVFKKIRFPLEIKLGEDLLTLFHAITISSIIIYNPKRKYFQMDSQFNSGNIASPAIVYHTIHVMETVYRICTLEYKQSLDTVKIALVKRCVGFYIRCNPHECTYYQMTCIRKCLLDFIRNNHFGRGLPLRYKISIYIILVSPGLYHRLVELFLNFRRSV